MRLSYNIINGLKEMTGSEIDFLIHVAQFQDGQAVAGGFDYRTVCEKIDTAKSNFYKVIKSLRLKKVINTRHEYDNWAFDILGNEGVFEAREKGDNERYLYLNLKFLHSKEFISMKKNEKLICLKLIELSYRKEREIYLTYKKLEELTGAKRQSVKQYAKTLKSVFKDMCRLGDNGIYITNKLDGNEQKVQGKRELFVKREKAEDVVKKTQNLIFWCKKNKIGYALNELEDTAALYNQYKNKIPDTLNRETFITGKIFKCIEQKGRVIAAYVNTLIWNALEEINTEKQPETIYVPRAYGDYFIPYKWCYDKSKMRKKIDELLEDVILNYTENKMAREVLSITKDNLVSLLTSKRSEVKKAILTHRQVYDKLMNASMDAAAGVPTRECFVEFIEEFIKEALDKLPRLDVKIPKIYLKSWLYDTMDKKTSSL